MRRKRTVHLAISLVLGLAAAIVVARYGVWWFAGNHVYQAAADSGGYTQLRRSWAEFESSFNLHMPDESPISYRDAREIRRVFERAQWGQTVSPGAFWGQGQERQALMLENGWPMRMTWGVFMHSGSNAVSGATQCKGVVLIPSGPSASSIVPWYPLMLGTVVDVAFWSVPWWVGIWAVHRVWTARRRKAGHCPHCGYDMAGLASGAKCPECGR